MRYLDGHPATERGQAWRLGRPARREACGIITFALATLACTAPAAAQTRSARSPLVTAIAGNTERFVLAPDISATYDTNVLRASDARLAGSKDNIRVDPGVAVRLNRIFGRTRVSLAGRAGYDFNSRFKQLNNARIDLGTGIDTGVGSLCHIGGDARVQIQQFELDELDVNQGGSLHIQTYGVDAGCDRPAGISPLGSVAYRKLSSDRRALFNYDVLTYTAGLAYARPSLGELTLTGSRSKIDRYNIAQVLGFEDNTVTDRIELALSRSVSPRLRGRLGGGYLHANPRRPGVPSFGGFSFDGEITYLPIPRFAVLASASRDAQSQAGFNASYTIVDSYLARVSYTITQRSAVDATFTQTRRRFRGEDPRLSIARGGDLTRNISAGYTLDIRQTLRAGVRVGHRWRDSQNSLFDYDSTSVTVSLGARF
ncbi:outer membrane beta-barrel protein [Sphingomonas profundi]|uniref:outer membrane beta-barrel protein n=1 Tax=Alterirhizorhabdus profundi TaxID=2681549 RepID=UPI0018D1C569|nr:outer membrane beta-barrel protein [Sphingomonas profundi]